MKLRASCKTKEAKILNYIINNDNMADEYEKALQSNIRSMMTPNEAFGVLIDAKLTREGYQLIRSKAKQSFPSYKVVQEAKKKCYPKNIIASESCVCVNLQSLLNHTTERIMESMDYKHSKLNLKLYSKWGIDGSTGHNPWKQAYLNASDTDSMSL